MNRKLGFTLIELLVVMALLAILLGIGAGAFASSMRKGRDNTRKANLRAIATALELYFNDKGKYPVWDGVGSIPGCYNAGGSTGSCGTADYSIFKDSIANGAMWMAKFPIDPVTGQKYYYVSDALGKQYQIYAHLENSQDTTIMTPATSGTDCGTGTPCNWGLSSANTNP
jgi:prepilin-type N-terminal cleavage/methylation domain-containing protein